MESPEEMEPFPLLSLPRVVFDTITQFLSVKDLSACCATSRRMRHIFNDDLIWKRRCREDLAEYLKTTPCRVEPPFVKPEVEDSTLRPMSQWRVSYMRERHLWNNWRHGRKVQEEIINQNSKKSKYDCIFHMFYDNDTVIALFRDKIEIVDVRNCPARDRTSPICPIVNLNSDLKPIVGEKMFIALYHSGVYVYDINLDTDQCLLKHFFFFEESQKKQVERTEDVRKIFDTRNVHHRRVQYCTFRQFFVGILETQSVMHIWNLESGLKLKEVKCPYRNSTIVNVKSTNAGHLVILIWDNNLNIFVLLAYGFETMGYILFREQFENEPQYIVHRDSVAVVHNNLLSVYNFKAPAILLKDVPINFEPKVFGKNFIFIQEGDLKVFNPSTKVLKQLPLAKIVWFEVLSDRFIQIEQNGILSIWQIDKFNWDVKPTTMNLQFRSCGFFINKASTRYIVRYGCGNIIHFW